MVSASDWGSEGRRFESSHPDCGITDSRRFPWFLKQAPGPPTQPRRVVLLDQPDADREPAKRRIFRPIQCVPKPPSLSPPCGERAGVRGS